MDDKLIDFLLSCPDSSEADTATLPLPVSDIECTACESNRATDSLLDGRWATPVFCGGCDRWYYAGSDSLPQPQRGEHEQRLHKRLAVALSARAKMESGELGAILSSLRRQLQYGGVERRVQSRSLRSEPIVVVPLNDDGELIEAAAGATLLDYSSNGLSFLGTAVSRSPYYLIDLSLGRLDRVQLIAKSVWCEEMEEYEKHGCQVLMDVSEL